MRKFSLSINQIAYVVALTVIISFLPKLTLAAVLWDNSYTGTSYNVAEGVAAGNFYSQMPQWSGSGAFYPHSGTAFSGTVSTLRVKRLSGVACSLPNNVAMYATNGGTRIGSAGTGVANGDYCDFPITGSDATDQALGVIFMCVNGGCTNSSGSLVLDGSPANPGYLVNGQQTAYQAGGYAFQLCDSGGCSGGFTTPSGYFAKIKNTGSGYKELRSASSTSADVLKTLPEDWVVYVASSTNPNGSAITANGYNWYKVVDPTDDVVGWITGSNASNTVSYLPYQSLQSEFEALSSDYIATSSRPDLILEIVDHYYNNTSTSTSLYSSSDHSQDIAYLKEFGFEEKIIWGVIADESGPAPYSFNNELISSDYGHGLMQITLNPSYPYDNRGYISDVTVPPCALDGDLYEECYTEMDGAPYYLRHYMPYEGNSSNPTYKSYTNTEQSMYANIKDGLGDLVQKLYSFDDISASTTINGLVYSPVERASLSATAAYNGGCTTNEYLGRVASKLDTIDTYFPTATSSDITGLIEKMQNVAATTTCVQLYSPGGVSIVDSKGRVVGVSDKGDKNDYPFAIFDKDLKYAKILGANEDDVYKYEVYGTDKGIYSLDIVLNGFASKSLMFKSVDIPILPGQKHIYSFSTSSIKEGRVDVTLSVDRDNDGESDRIVQAGSELLSRTYNIEATKEELDAIKYGHGSHAAIERPDSHMERKFTFTPKTDFETKYERDSDYDPNKETIIPLNQKILNVNVQYDNE